MACSPETRSRHAWTAISSTPFGCWSFREVSWRPWPLSDICLASSEAPSSPELPAQQRVCRSGNCKAVSLYRVLCVAFFPSIVCHPRGWLKQCVSYRFCLPALISLFCSSKQTFSIYRSVHLTKKSGALAGIAALSHHLLEPEALNGPEAVNDSSPPCRPVCVGFCGQLWQQREGLGVRLVRKTGIRTLG